MAIEIQGNVGPEVAQDGSVTSVRLGKGADVIVSELHGRFYEQNYRQTLYAGGISALTSINAATFQVATLGATCTPLVGLWNPSTSTVHAVILQATLSITMTSQTNTGIGPYAWAFSTGNAAISTGNIPWNRRTLSKAGSQVKDMSGVALTGLTNSLVVAHASSVSGGSSVNAGVIGTAVGFQTLHTCSVENLDGSIIVPPGGVIALLGTATPSAHSAVSGLLWEEVPI
mgnify:CR=1 FL=1